MSWEDQGRQEHAWFGHGTAPTRLDDTDTADGATGSLGQRIAVVAYGAIASQPPAPMHPGWRHHGLWTAWTGRARPR